MSEEATRFRIAAWIAAALALFLIVRLHLLPAFLAGMLVFELVHVLAPLLARRTAGPKARLAAVAVIVVLSLAATAGAIFGMAHFFRSEGGGLHALFAKMAEILENSRSSLPEWLLDSLPDTAEGIREAVVDWLREHGQEVQLVGKEAGLAVAHVLVGMAIGAIVALGEAKPAAELKPLAAALTERARRVGDAFRRVVFAQIRISALNTVFSAIYLAAVLPLLGIHLPLVKTMIAITFVLGLLPVVGNLVSNTVVVIVSLAHSPAVAMGSLGFLVVIHKLEYFLNARIVGSQISAKAWELLLAMLAMEAAFGLPGLVAAPIYYAYLKDELTAAGAV